MNIECLQCGSNWWENSWYYLWMVNRLRNSRLSHAAISNCFSTWWLEINFPLVHMVWNGRVIQIRNYGVESISHLSIKNILECGNILGIDILGCWLNHSKARATISRLMMNWIVLSRQSWIVNTMLNLTIWLLCWIILCLSTSILFLLQSICGVKLFLIVNTNRLSCIFEISLLLYLCLSSVHRISLFFSVSWILSYFSLIMMISAFCKSYFILVILHGFYSNFVNSLSCINDWTINTLCGNFYFEIWLLRKCAVLYSYHFGIVLIIQYHVTLSNLFQQY